MIIDITGACGTITLMQNACVHQTILLFAKKLKTSTQKITNFQQE